MRKKRKAGEEQKKKKNPFDDVLKKSRLFGKLASKGNQKIVSYNQKLKKELLEPIQENEEKASTIGIQEAKNNN